MRRLTVEKSHVEAAKPICKALVTAAVADDMNLVGAAFAALDEIPE